MGDPMNLEVENKTTHRILWGAVAVILVLAVVLGFFYFRTMLTEKDRMTQFSDSFFAGEAALKKGTAGSELRFQEALERAKTPTEQAMAELYLGTAYLQSDPAKAVAILKRVSLNESYPPEYRASAGELTLRPFMADKNISFALENVFTGSVWADFMKDTPTDRDGVVLGVRRAYEWVTSVGPNFIAEYRAALWYAQEVQSKHVKGQKLDEYLSIIELHVARGDELLEQAPKNPRVFNTKIGIGYDSRAHTMRGLYSAGRASEKEVVDSYKKALDYFEKSPGESYAAASAPYVRFHLARFLVSIDPIKNKNEALALLAPVYERTSSNFYKYLSNERDAAVYGTDPVRAEIVMLAKFDPKFKTLLTSLGWKEGDF